MIPRQETTVPKQETTVPLEEAATLLAVAAFEAPGLIGESTILASQAGDTHAPYSPPALMQFTTTPPFSPTIGLVFLGNRVYWHFCHGNMISEPICSFLSLYFGGQFFQGLPIFGMIRFA